MAVMHTGPADARLVTVPPEQLEDRVQALERQVHELSNTVQALVLKVGFETCNHECALCPKVPICGNSPEGRLK